MTIAMLIMAFSMGFFGSPHCLGMCGGIVTAFGLSMQALTPQKKSMMILTYHLGRLCSYAFLGLLAGIIGTTVLEPLMVGNRIPAIILGAILIVIGLSMLGMPFLNKLEKLGGKLWQKLSPVRQKVFPLDSFGKAFGAGLLWGFLPCGLVYGALMMSAVGHNRMSGALLMFVFGLGTMPMLIATQSTVIALKQRIKQFKLRQINGVAMALSGMAVIIVPILMHGSGGHNHHAHHATPSVTMTDAMTDNASQQSSHEAMHETMTGEHDHAHHH